MISGGQSLHLRCISEIALVIEGSARSVPSVQFPEEMSHNGDHGLLSGHGDSFAVVVFTIKALASYQRQHDLAEDLPQQRPPLLGDPVLPSVDAGLSHADVETGVAQ